MRFQGLLPLALLAAALPLAGCQPDAALRKGEVIDRGTQPASGPARTTPMNNGQRPQDQP